MILKSIDSKIGKVHCLRVNRLVKKTNGLLKKEPFTFVLTDVELKNLQKSIENTTGGVDEHLLAVPVRRVDRRKAINTVVDPKFDRRDESAISVFGTDLEIEV